MKLMVPGPAETATDDLVEMARPLLPHYGGAFLEVWHAVHGHMKTVFGTTSDVIMLPGAGTAGTEMALCGFAKRKCIVVRAGTFSERLIEILEARGSAVVAIDVPERHGVSPDDVREALKQHPDTAAVCMVHSETSTGILHPVREVAEVVRESDALLVVDAVSSMGALDFQMDAWGVDVCWTASQKALASPPGMAFVAINERAFKAIEANAENVASWYLSPLVWKWHADNWEWHPYPTSLPTPVFVSMRKVLDRLVAEGLDKHYARQHKAAAAIRAGCRAIGFEVYPLSDAFASPTITALIPPAGLDEAAFRESVLSDHDVMIAGGFGSLRGQIVRVGHMGPGIGDDYVLTTLQAMESSARKHGVACVPGCAISAAFGT